MKTEEYDYSWVDLQILDQTTGEKFSNLDCPSHVREVIHHALSRGEQTGICAHAGHLFRWAHVVTIEVYEEGTVTEKVPVEWVQWQALALYSNRRGVSAEALLTAHVAEGLRDGQSVREPIEFLLGSGEDHWKIEDDDDETETEERAYLVNVQ